ncbi:MAG: hypothetical protein IAX21_07855 [Candidatus Bathyarchaeota archaeon]|nr:MAG: hypothetical protein IAX21_07855 [Candidatus Bathyarchaeota archaeon]
MNKTKRLFVAALFGAIISLTKVFLPFPMDKMFIIVQAVLLAISALFIKKIGATYVGAIDGALTVLWRPALGPFTFAFAFLYGILVDAFFIIFKIHPSMDKVNPIKIVVAMTLSTAIVGFLSYYITVVLLELLPMEPGLAVPILIMSIISGAVAGYAAAYLWNKHLKNILV